MKSWHDVLIAAGPPVRFLEQHAFFGAAYRGDPVAHNVVRDAAIARHFATDDSFNDFDHSEFSARTGLPFENGVDDLDEYLAGLLLDDRVGPRQFMCYINAPIKGVVVSVDSPVKTAHAVDVVKKRFGCHRFQVGYE
ncbi:hypothetical protein G3O00_19470 [Burkholderia sp. Ac-20384]|uniref:hypothetical protein n=1 Tax=Burkholderia sp. Ac-20384 TaxID=2703902 RepID=UPI001981A753|nr:hypothetical protein [Burkholderia sp. Ac-20384]MBN3825788.1 hypothetical protein [Burkholderia sp. Ac-20384]